MPERRSSPSLDETDVLQLAGDEAAEGLQARLRGSSLRGAAAGAGTAARGMATSAAAPWPAPLLPPPPPANRVTASPAGAGRAGSPSGSARGAARAVQGVAQARRNGHGVRMPPRTGAAAAMAALHRGSSSMRASRKARRALRRRVMWGDCVPHAAYALLVLGALAAGHRLVQRAQVGPHQEPHPTAARQWRPRRGSVREDLSAKAAALRRASAIARSALFH